jgi:hypothetical protein
MKDILTAFALGMVFWLNVWMLVYVARHAWGAAENRTKKVCDVCFRDIDKYNQKVKEMEAQD